MYRAGLENSKEAGPSGLSKEKGWESLGYLVGNGSWALEGFWNSLFNPNVWACFQFRGVHGLFEGGF